jgi:hypothetical protein
MPLEISVKRLKSKKAPNVYYVFLAKQLVLDDECKKLEAIFVDEEAFYEICLNLTLLNDSRLFKLTKNSNFKTNCNKNNLSIEFVGDLNESVVFLRRSNAIGQHTEERLTTFITIRKSISSATVLSTTPSP